MYVWQCCRYLAGPHLHPAGQVHIWYYTHIDISFNVIRTSSDILSRGGELLLSVSNRTRCVTAALVSQNVKVQICNAAVRCAKSKLKSRMAKS